MPNAKRWSIFVGSQKKIGGDYRLWEWALILVGLKQ
jgi:hypothetical protein